MADVRDWVWGPPPPSTRFVTSVIRDKVHRDDCPWARSMDPWNVRHLYSIEAAVKPGLKPCRTCRPLDSHRLWPDRFVLSALGWKYPRPTGAALERVMDLGQGVD